MAGGAAESRLTPPSPYLPEVAALDGMKDDSPVAVVTLTFSPGKPPYTPGVGIIPRASVYVSGAVPASFRQHFLDVLREPSDVPSAVPSISNSKDSDLYTRSVRMRLSVAAPGKARLCVPMVDTVDTLPCRVRPCVSPGPKCEVRADRLDPGVCMECLRGVFGCARGSHDLRVIFCVHGVV